MGTNALFDLSHVVNFDCCFNVVFLALWPVMVARIFLKVILVDGAKARRSGNHANGRSNCLT